ncbi:uncharacterized protein J3R85_009750 [Psidium guajava]|nr:uncharacterized protein J3R85_009750 [Psidium guajava]
MIATEFVQPPPKEEPVDTDPVQVPCNDDDDGEDALSLCNLSLYCDAADDSFADDSSSTLPSSSSSSSDHEGFLEFSSFGDSGSSSDLRSDDRHFVFCGKLIPRRVSPQNLPSTTPHRPPPEDERLPLQTGCGSQKSTSGRAGSQTVRRGKCRWYMMAFGLARFPTEMALGEMRTRQSRNAQKKALSDGGGDESKAKGLFGLLKALGLGHRGQADALVKASLGCVRA